MKFSLNFFFRNGSKIIVGPNFIGSVGKPGTILFFRPKQGLIIISDNYRNIISKQILGCASDFLVP